MRAQASDEMRRTVRHWPRALFRDAPEIFEIPPWPLGWILLGAFVLVAGKSFVVAELGKLDLEIGIHGRILAPPSLAEIRSFESGVIGAVLVREGQAVRRGDALLEVASPATAARIDRLVRDRREASLDLLRLAAQLRDDPRALNAPPDADPELVERARWKLASELASEWHARPVRVGAPKGKTVRIHAEGAGIAAPSGTLIGAGTKFVSRTRVEHAKAAERIESIDRKLAQAYRTLRVLRAPVDGIVRGVEALADGNAIAAAQTLMTILPADADIEIETRLTTRDMRWIVAGQRIVLQILPANSGYKMQVDGEITWVARDPVADARLGWVHPVRIRIARQSLSDPNIAPRMETPINGDIRLGPLSMIDWLMRSLSRERLVGAANTPLAQVRGTR